MKRESKIDFRPLQVAKRNSAFIANLRAKDANANSLFLFFDLFSALACCKSRLLQFRRLCCELRNDNSGQIGRIRANKRETASTEPRIAASFVAARSSQRRNQSIKARMSQKSLICVESANELLAQIRFRRRLHQSNAKPKFDSFSQRQATKRANLAPNRQ